MLQTERSVLLCQREKRDHDVALTELPLALSPLSPGPLLGQKGKKQALLALRPGFKQTGRAFIRWPFHSYWQALRSKKFRSKRTGPGQSREGGRSKEPHPGGMGWQTLTLSPSSVSPLSWMMRLR